MSREAPMMPDETDRLDPGLEQEPLALVDLVNRVLDRGVVLHGDVTISVADVDLIYMGLRVLLTSVDALVAEDARGLGLTDERRERP